MCAHDPDCRRARWLLDRPKAGLFWAVLLLEGPACSCGAADPRLFSPEQSTDRDGSGR